MQNALINLKKEDFNKVERLILKKRGIQKLKDEEDQTFQTIIKSIAQGIKYLRFKNLVSLNSFAKNGKFKLNDFQNLQQLSISKDRDETQHGRYFSLIFQQLNDLQNLQKLYNDFEGFSLNIDQITQYLQIFLSFQIWKPSDQSWAIIRYQMMDVKKQLKLLRR
ncbi:hypothetical protein ABPG72_011982 [Tetrahymena utriculariae]